MPEGPLVIGLAGTIAAGKSTVGQILVAQGAVHCDADKLVHRLYDPGTPGFARVVAEFGEDVVGPDGYVDRKILGSKVFGKPEEMTKLTKAMGSITEAIKAEIDGWRETMGDGELAVMEAVNLMEPGYGRWCDVVWLIGVDDDVARLRLLKSRNMTEAEANQRLASMRPFEQRAPGADWTYKNNGTRDQLEAAVLAELSRVRTLFAKGELPKSVFEPWWHAELEKRGMKEALEKAGTPVKDTNVG